MRAKQTTRVLRTLVAAGIMSLSVAGSLFAQHPYGLDPYKPSDAELLRLYGPALVTPTPLRDLAQLDPYKPSERALLNQLGGALPIPVWGWASFPPYVPGLTPQPSLTIRNETPGATVALLSPSLRTLPGNVPALPQAPANEPPELPVAGPRRPAEPPVASDAPGPKETVFRVTVHEETVLEADRPSPVPDLVELSIRLRRARAASEAQEQAVKSARAPSAN